MTAFDLATDSLFTDQNLAIDALLRLGGTGPAQPIRVIRAMPVQFASFGEGRFVVDTVLLNIRLADAPVLSAGDTVEIAGQLHRCKAPHNPRYQPLGLAGRSTRAVKLLADI